MFIVYYNDLDTGIDSRISKFPHDIKMGRIIEAELSLQSSLMQIPDNLMF